MKTCALLRELYMFVGAYTRHAACHARRAPLNGCIEAYATKMTNEYYWYTVRIWEPLE